VDLIPVDMVDMLQDIIIIREVVLAIVYHVMLIAKDAILFI